MISPELILSRRFISNVLRNSELSRRLLSIIVDEAHVVSHWGSGFRKKYGSLGILRALIPKGTPMIAMSATLPARVRQDVLKKLQYNQKEYTYINMGNDRVNVSLIVRGMQHPMNTFRDLAFVIPKDIKDRSEIKKTWIYVDSVSTGTEVAEYLYTLLPDSFRHEGVVYNYNAVFSSTNRQQLMDLFRAGIVRVLICTDAAGMVRQLIICYNTSKSLFRDVTYQISIWLSSGSFHRRFLHLFSELGELRGVLGEQELRCFLSSNQCITQTS
jgi:superfamily II DNA helicase RecQ